MYKRGIFKFESTFYLLVLEFDKNLTSSLLADGALKVVPFCQYTPAYSAIIKLPQRSSCKYVSSTACVSSWNISTVSSRWHFNLVFSRINSEKTQMDTRHFGNMGGESIVYFCHKVHIQQGRVRGCFVVVQIPLLIS